MPAKKKSASPNIKELSAKSLSYRINFKPEKTKTSDDLKPCNIIIGQERAVEAIKTGLRVKSVGFNIFVTGLAGTGRTTTIKHLLENLNHKTPKLNDICYINNFKNEDSPQILTLKAGDGRRFRKDMGYLVSSMRKIVPKIFMSEDYKDRNSRIVREFEGRQKDLISDYEDKLTEAGFVMVQVQSSMGVRNEIHPLVENEPVSLESLERQSKEDKFSASKLEELGRAWDSLRREFDSVSVESKKLSEKLEDALAKLDLSIISPMVMDKVNVIKKRFQYEKVHHYLDEVAEEMTGDIDRFREAQPRRGEEEPPPYRKREPFEEFSVNLILDNSETKEVPIVIEKSPSYKNIFGSLERVVDRFGYWRTDFTRIFSGSILKASGGFFIINAIDLLSEPGMWVQLKRALRNREIQITGYDPFYMMAGAGIKPEPIPLDVKVILIGEPEVYHMLWRMDNDFKKIFKIKSEFDSVMPLSNKNLRRYFEFVCRVTKEEVLLPFDVSGMQGVCEFARKISGKRTKLSTRFNIIADLVRESSFCAQKKKAKKVNRDDIYQVMNDQRYRLNLVEEKIQEMYDENTLMVSTSGKVVGQINGLSVYNLGEYSFGRPARITVNTALGKEGIINIERESDLSGPIHNKGVLILTGYLRKMFAQNKPLSMSASISFEQSYSGVDGDSASSTEIYAILSSIAEIPIRQDLAVTGSVNQKGEIQPIGGANEKIEGFFDVCKSRKLTGHQGVIIPHQNVADLLLRPDVIQAVEKGIFHIFPVKTIEDGIEILTGIKAGKKNKKGKFSDDTVFGMVDKKLFEMAIALQNFGRITNNNSKK